MLSQCGMTRAAALQVREEGLSKGLASFVPGNPESSTLPTQMVQILYVATTLGWLMEVLSSISRAMRASALAGSPLSPPEPWELELLLGMCECSTTFTATMVDFHRALKTFPYPARGHAVNIVRV